MRKVFVPVVTGKITAAFFLGHSVYFRENLKILLEIISIGRLLVLFINFHADLILNFAIPLFYDTLYVFNR